MAINIDKKLIFKAAEWEYQNYNFCNKVVYTLLAE